MKTRGLKEARVKLGDLEEIISNLLKKKEKIKIFESGCGYGKVMIELSKKFGNKIEIVGMNLKPSHGNKEIMLSFALKNKIIEKSDLKNFNIPKIIYGDAGEKLPFKSGSIDLVYSQTSAYLYKDKMHFFEEVARILSKKGIGLITAPLYSGDTDKEELKEILRIYDKGDLTSFKEYIKQFKNIKLIQSPAGKRVVQISSGKLNFKLKLISTINLNDINKKWFGIISIYSK